AVLNDWDISTASTFHAPPARSPLPAPPSVTFAAVDLLSKTLKYPIPHLYSHDLEAFIWVFVWVACCVEHGTSPRCVENGQRVGPWPKVFQDWASGDVKRCQTGKFRVLYFGFEAVGPASTWAAGPASIWAAEGLLANYLRFHLRTEIHSTQAEVEWDVTENATPPEEEDAPEKDWKEF
ncbi:hypothetical protein EV121DRAFT_172040, partial [Schizophyllum commune]